MTATHVDGVEVVVDEPTPSPIKDRTGQPVVWTQTRTLLLADGRTVYGCQHCDYTSPNANSVRPHLNRHNRRPKPTGPAAVAAAEMSLSELIAKAAQIDELTASLEEWKKRARTAEAKLRTLRNALGGGQ